MAITTPVTRGHNTNTTNNTTAAVTTVGACTAGNLLLYLFVCQSGATLSSVSGGGATWTITENPVNGASVCVAIAWAIVPGGGIADSTTITGTVSANNTRKCMALVEIGVDGGWSWPASPVDKHTNATGSSTTTFSSGTTAATTQADELVICAFGNAGNCTAFTAGTGYTVAPYNSNTGLLVVSAGSTPRSLLAEFKIVSATGAQGDVSTNAVTTTAGTFAGAVVTFAPTGATGNTFTKAGTGAFGPAT